MRSPGLAHTRALPAVFVGAGLVALFPAVTPAQEADGRTRASTLAVLRQEHRYVPAIRQKALDDVAAAEGVVRMDPFPVTESKAGVLFARYLDEQRRKEEATKPSLANGVQVPGLPERVEVGVKPYKDILPFGSSVPRWNIINLRF